LFFSLLVFFFPLATLWPIRRWIHIGDDAYNIDPLHPSLSKFVESSKLTFLFITSDVFFLSFQRLVHRGMSFKTYQA
jgi:hypothetical protein